MTTRKQFYESWRYVRHLMGNAPMGRIRSIPTRHANRGDLPALFSVATACWSGVCGNSKTPPGCKLVHSDGIPAGLKQGMTIDARLAWARRVRQLRLSGA